MPGKPSATAGRTESSVSRSVSSMKKFVGKRLAYVISPVCSSNKTKTETRLPASPAASSYAAA